MEVMEKHSISCHEYNIAVFRNSYLCPGRTTFRLLKNEFLKFADVDSDNHIDVDDALRVLQIGAGVV